MKNKKMVETIEKKVGVAVECVNGYEQNGKEILVDVDLADGSSNHVVLKEAQNQYGVYYRFVSITPYEKEIEVEEEIKAEEKVEIKAERQASAKLKTKTERLCGARRKDIIEYASRTIASLASGSATFKEIEGPANDDTTIRFVLISNIDGARFKEDIAISEIREFATA